VEKVIAPEEEEKLKAIIGKVGLGYVPAVSDLITRAGIVLEAAEDCDFFLVRWAMDDFYDRKLTLYKFLADGLAERKVTPDDFAEARAILARAARRLGRRREALLAKCSER